VQGHRAIADLPPTTPVTHLAGLARLASGVDLLV
jgi:hypothetical protein